jgi:LSU ribosomal protein L19E|nr:MAG: ribosomal protein L19E [Candidatus Nanosalinarum sp. J07AB56]
MTDLKPQKRMAAEIMDVGENRVWMDSEQMEKISEAITRQDIRNLVEDGTIRKRDKKGNSKGRSREVKRQKQKGRRKGHGSRKGEKSARSNRDEWVEGIRAIRSELKDMKQEDDINNDTYWELYEKASGGFFRNVRHLKNHVSKEVEQ